MNFIFKAETMKSKIEILNLYLGDLQNIVPESPARNNRIEMVKDEISQEVIRNSTCEYGDREYDNCPDWKEFTNGCADCLKYHKNK